MGSSTTKSSRNVCKYMDQKDSAATLAIKRPTVATPQVSLRVMQAMRHTSIGFNQTLNPRRELV